MEHDDIDFSAYVVGKIIDFFEDKSTQTGWEKNQVAVQIRSLYIDILHEQLKKKDPHE